MFLKTGLLLRGLTIEAGLTRKYLRYLENQKNNVISLIEDFVLCVVLYSIVCCEIVHEINDLPFMRNNDYMLGLTLKFQVFLPFYQVTHRSF